MFGFLKRASNQLDAYERESKWAEQEANRLARAARQAEKDSERAQREAARQFARAQRLGRGQG